METGHGIKYRQLHMEDYLREIPAERGRVTGVYAHEWITGNPDTDTDVSHHSEERQPKCRLPEGQGESGSRWNRRNAGG